MPVRLENKIRDLFIGYKIKMGRDEVDLKYYPGGIIPKVWSELSSSQFLKFLWYLPSSCESAT